jgi:hypothetical protein
MFLHPKYLLAVQVLVPVKKSSTKESFQRSQARTGPNGCDRTGRFITAVSETTFECKEKLYMIELIDVSHLHGHSVVFVA